jgi:hypothetical protein
VISSKYGALGLVCTVLTTGLAVAGCGSGSQSTPSSVSTKPTEASERGAKEREKQQAEATEKLALEEAHKQNAENKKREAEEAAENRREREATERAAEHSRLVTHLLRERGAIGLPLSTVRRELGKPESLQEESEGEVDMYYTVGNNEYQVVVEHGRVTRINREER